MGSKRLTPLQTDLVAELDTLIRGVGFAIVGDTRFYVKPTGECIVKTKGKAWQTRLLSKTALVEFINMLKANH
jgi:hypothetical protein